MSMMTNVGEWTDKSDESSRWWTAHDNKPPCSWGHGQLHVQVA